MRRFALAMLTTMGTISACSLFTTLDGFSGPSDAGAPNDALAADAPVDGTDSTTDASASDADGAPKRFCETVTGAPIVCEDFDDGAVNWTRETSAGATTTLSTSRATSPPSALYATVPATDAGAGFARFHRDVPIQASHARLSYSVWIDERPTGNYEVNILRFRDAPNSYYDIYLAVDDTNTRLIEQRNGVGNRPVPITLPIATKTWARLSIEVTLSEPQSIAVTLDGAYLGKVATVYASPGFPAVNAGITYVDTTEGSSAVYIDDLVFEILP